ncbi:MAG: hypothetical protein ACREKL_08450 [Chthoniobacterales bacterium]
MDPIEILLASVMSFAGIAITSFTVVASMRQCARDDRDRELFHAYINDPHGIEAWLANGAIELLEQSLPSLAEESAPAESDRLDILFANGFLTPTRLASM